MDERTLTPWFAGSVKPARAGMYRAQDSTMRCECCWFDAYWNGREWFSDLLTPGRFKTVMFRHELKRWRGLRAAASIGSEISKGQKPPSEP